MTGWTDEARAAAAAARGSHQKGVDSVGRRFQAIVQPYSLAEGKVGERVGSEKVLSSHNSLGAAGKVLGSHISGKNAKVPQSIAGHGNGYRIFVRDTHTGVEHSRNDAAAVHARAKAGFGHFKG